MNAAGDLAVRLSDELNAVEDAAMVEAHRWQRSHMREREDRSKLIAERIIEEGDGEETAIVIRELATYATDQART